MKFFNKNNPLLWFWAFLLIGWVSIDSGNFEFIVIGFLASIISKQVEILNK